MTSPIRFSSRLAHGENYPARAFSIAPRIPGSNSPRPRHLPANVDTTLLTTRAQFGLGLIAKAELRKGDTVLLPAYHCPALVEPFLWAGCQIRFYTMNADLSPNLDVLKKQLTSARAIVLVRYFGFSGNVASLVELAHAQGCLVIEDLAHAPFVDELYGDFGVTSLVKFFPVKAVAEIWVARGRDSDALLQTLKKYRRSPLLWQLGSTLAKLRRRILPKKWQKMGEREVFRYCNEQDMLQPVSPGPLREIARHDEAELIEARRRNYRFLNKFLMISSIGSPLYPGLERGDVPYVYPFVLRDLETFDKIRNAGIPLLRWEELAPSRCEISKSYRSALIQIPCHQDLSARNLDRIEATFRALDERR